MSTIAFASDVITSDVPFGLYLEGNEYDKLENWKELTFPFNRNHIICWHLDKEIEGHLDYSEPTEENKRIIKNTNKRIVELASDLSRFDVSLYSHPEYQWGD